MLYRMEENNFLLMIFFTLCKGKSGFVALFILLKSCFFIPTVSLYFYFL